jgi:hypothetical protein
MPVNQLIKTILSNRYVLLLATLTAYLLVVVAEGAITGREARLLDFENPFFDLNIGDFEEFQTTQSGEDPEVM